MMEIGRVCTKLVGREAGEVCVIVEVVDKTYAVVTGPKVRRRVCNVKHLEPHPKTVAVEKGASDEAVIKALEGEGLA